MKLCIRSLDEHEKIHSNGIPWSIYRFGRGFAEELSSNLITVDAYLEKIFPNTHMPGMCIVIVNADSVLYSRSFGDCESVDTPFIIGSISKSFTAAAIMQLAEQGKVDLDASVPRYLQIDLDNKVTIRHLLNHTSGFHRYQIPKDLTIHKSYGEYSYSNLNYTLLGEVIEVVTGLSYGDYMRSYTRRKRILRYGLAGDNGL